MVITANAEGRDYLVILGASSFFCVVDFFRACYFCSSSTNDNMKICCNIKSDVLFHAVSLVFAKS